MCVGGGGVVYYVGSKANHLLIYIKKAKQNTVKCVYSNHLGDEVSVVVLGRWSLQRRPVKGSIIFHLITHDTDKKNQLYFHSKQKTML